MKIKICNQCHIEKPISEYHRDNGLVGGRKNQCKKCRNKDRKNYEWSKKTRHKYRGCVYCVECQGFYKIGVTSAGMKKRMSGMRTNNPFDINVVWVARTSDMIKYERMIHNQIKDSHVRGEWYAIPKVLAKELRNIVKNDGTF